MNTAPNPVHIHRAHLLSKERRYRIEADGLHWDSSDGERGRLAFEDVQSCQLRYAPTRFASQRYEMTMGTRQGQPLTLSNMHFEGLGRFEARSASYRALVIAWLDALQQHRPDLPVQIGNSNRRHRLYQLLALALLVVLVLVTLTLLATGLWGIALIKLVLLVVMLPLLWRYLQRNRPRPLQPGISPDSVLPPADA